MIEIDGSEGEGGGQILRSALSLAVCTQQPFRIANIRANRKRPGLMRQHLTSVRAAAEICGATVTGAQIESRALEFRPGTLRAGDFSFDIGTAGSCTLVLQTVLPPLLSATASSTVRVFGGTHNPSSPPYDFLARAFAPQLTKMGAPVELTLAAFGFHPRGGGEIRARITPASRLAALSLTTRGAPLRAYAEAYVAALPAHVATRELDVIGRQLGFTREQLHVRALANDLGPGNAVTITLEYEHVTEVFAGFGERGVRAEDVALGPAREATTYLAATAPVGEHLADQLLLPMALGAGGVFLTSASTAHLHSNAEVVRRFTGRNVTIATAANGVEVIVS